VPGELGTLNLPLQRDQLLAQESVFEDQFWLGAGHIEGGIEGEGMVVRLGPLAKRPFDGLPERIDISLGKGNEREIHGLPFSWKIEPQF
jgi:hypothetical protein